MTQLIATLKQFAVGDGIHPTSVYVFGRVAIAFVVGLIAATLLI